MIDGARTTSVERAIADVAREDGVSSAVVAADAAVRLGALDLNELDEIVRQQRRWPAVARARRALASIDGRAESPLESLSRLHLLRCGVPAPVLQQEIGDEYGSFVGRVDFYWDEFGLVGEADGAAKYDLPAVIAEKQRQSRLLELGLVVVRWTWADLSAFDDVERRLRAALRRGLRRGDRRRGWTLLADPDLAPRL